jgi:transposase
MLIFANILAMTLAAKTSVNDQAKPLSAAIDMASNNQTELAETLAARDAEIASLGQHIAHLEQHIKSLSLCIWHLKRQKYGSKSEGMPFEQEQLFKDSQAEDIAAVEATLDDLRTQVQDLQNQSNKSGKSDKSTAPKTHPRRQEFSADLPRVDERLEGRCNCATCGNALREVGVEVSEKIDIQMPAFFIRRITRPVQACSQCQSIHTTPTAPEIINGGIAAPGLMAYVLIQKYDDHLPLYRISNSFARADFANYGVRLAESTLGDIVGQCGQRLLPLAHRLRELLLSSPVLHADETPVRQLDPGGESTGKQGKTKTAYLFSYREGALGKPALVVFDYQGSRSGKHARNFLANYQGALVVDDFAGYKALFEKQTENQNQTPTISESNQPAAIQEIACWAHARRKFFDLYDANQSPTAKQAIEQIAQLYGIEQTAKGYTPEQRKAYRDQHAAPRVETLFQWLISIRPSASPNSGIQKAIDYLLRRKAAFKRYLDDGSYPIDNNAVENAIRPIALGRKNWLFTGSHQAGVRAAAIMSLIQSAKANGHNPHAYLIDVLTRLPSTKDKDIDTLLPHLWKPVVPKIPELRATNTSD